MLSPIVERFVYNSLAGSKISPSFTRSDRCSVSNGKILSASSDEKSNAERVNTLATGSAQFISGANTPLSFPKKVNLF